MWKPLLNPPRLPVSGDCQQWHGLLGCAGPLSLYEALTKQRGFALVILQDGGELDNWHEALKLFANDDNDFTIIRFPDTETLPYDHFSPHPDITSDRLKALYNIQEQTIGCCLVTAASLLTRLCPRQHIAQNSLLISVGQSLDVNEFKDRLINAGYQHREAVYEHGEFAVRGSLLDLFPMGSELPYRIELFDTDIASLRTFDPESQRTINKIDAISILPAGEVSLDSKAVNQFRDQWHQHFDHDPDLCPVYRDTLAGISSPGIEAYLPMFFEHTSSLFDYLPSHTVIASAYTLNDNLKKRLAEISHRHEQQSIDPTRPLLPPNVLYLSFDQCRQQINQRGSISLRTNTDSSTAPAQTDAARGIYCFDTQPTPDLTIDEHAENPLAHFVETSQHAQYSNYRFICCVASNGRREVLLEKLSASGLHPIALDQWDDAFAKTSPENINTKPIVYVTINGLNQGALLSQNNLCIAAEAELFGRTQKPVSRRQKEKNNLSDASINSLLELRVGAPVVHIEHGVGRYRGLECMPVPVDANHSIDAEFLTLEYAGGDKLYVPVTSLHLVNRYMGGDTSSAPHNKLGSESWNNTRKKVIANVRDVAAELLAIYAKRKSMLGSACQLESTDYQRFCDQFPFEETPDQLSAIQAVIDDMCAETAMDRLVCGDVGFGKTEVAMRAAFLAASNSKQVMVLVPTTLLAQQHMQNFLDRFADWPIKTDVLSRFRSANEQKKVLADFSNGTIDILIGTHKLIQQSIQPKSLGLVIVDEEHRFGVRQKEQLKRLCANVDLLTMTATPIPRTLNMAMAGLRDLSIISTPPARRLSVKTFVHQKQSSLIKEALLRELLRGGQVFYLHNDVKTIERSKAELEQLLPEARVAIGHGQMPERELEQVMSDFYHKKYNILVCTTIIETGIDIPNANTIIIDRADKFGLAQLHQLRGRVGRSHHQAYAYLFIPNKKLLTVDAEKRLAAIEEAQDLGAGFMLATHDLEIRGAGELLGDEQSGQIQSIGFSLYIDMLDKAVAALKAGEEIDLSAPLTVQGEINLHLPALIPDDYLPDIHNRLMLYKRIASAATDDALRDLQVEMIDRFGLLPIEVKNLFAIMTIKLDCSALGIDKIDAGPEGGYIEFSARTQIDPMKIVHLVQSQPRQFQLKGATRLNFFMTPHETQQRISWIRSFVNDLGDAKAA